MLPQLKPGVLVSIQLGSAFIAKIQECFQLHVNGHEDDLQKLKNRNGDYDKEPLTAWENQSLMYSTLLQEIMVTAERDGSVEYVTMESMMGNIVAPTQKDHSS